VSVLTTVITRQMSAFGPKRTSLVAPHMSAFGGKADIIQGKADIKKCPLMTQSGHLRHDYVPKGQYHAANR